VSFPGTALQFREGVTAVSPFIRTIGGAFFLTSGAGRFLPPPQWGVLQGGIF